VKLSEMSVEALKRKAKRMVAAGNGWTPRYGYLIHQYRRKTTTPWERFAQLTREKEDRYAEQQGE